MGAIFVEAVETKRTGNDFFVESLGKLCGRGGGVIRGDQ